MTPLETILFILVWIFVGAFICVKRNWYKHRLAYGDASLFSTMSFLFAPISLTIVIIRVLIIDDWNNE